MMNNIQLLWISVARTSPALTHYNQDRIFQTKKTILLLISYKNLLINPEIQNESLNLIDFRKFNNLNLFSNTIDIHPRRSNEKATLYKIIFQYTYCLF